MKIAVAGTGYVGLVTGVCLSERGHDVVCVDLDKDKINLMKNGISPIHEANLQDLMNKNYNEKKIDYTVDYENAYKNADVIIIGVGTPERQDGSANLKFVYAVAKQIAESIMRDTLVVVKSTVPIGTNDSIEAYIKSHLVHDVYVEVASNPEFLAQGTAVHDTLNAKRIVLGVESKFGENLLRKVYEPFGQPLLFMNRRSAEMVKYASNDFLALKLSYINEIANLCELVQANIEDVTLGMGYDDRIGKKFMNAGCGYGGSCFPKDTKALHYLAGQNDYELKTVKAAIEVNESQKIILIKKARKHFGTFENLKVAVLGLTFKAGTDDLREAPSIDNIAILLDENANVFAYDPVGIDNYKKIYPNEIEYVNSPEEALVDAELCFIFTEWNEIRNINPEIFKRMKEGSVVLDGRNLFDKGTMERLGIEYESIGR